MRLLSLFYSLALSLLLLGYLPRVFFKKKRAYLNSKKALFSSKKKPVIWLHAVSLGETKALSTLLPHIKRSFPNAALFISSVTATGKEEAERYASQIDGSFYLPLDFAFLMRPLVKKLKPDLLILSEGDFWFHMLKEVKKEGGKIALVNGKLSERSFKRYRLVRTFSQSLLKQIDCFCVQDEAYLERFHALGIPKEQLHSIRSIKYDIPFLAASKLTFSKDALIVTIGSTHAGEEKALLEIFVPFLKKHPHLHLLLAPRHPERFAEVGALLKKMDLPFSTLSKREPNKQIVLVDQMGILATCYASSHLTLVGGSFVPGIGGHDIFEPAKMGKPVLFGPYMQRQQALEAAITKAGVGQKVSLSELTTTLETLLKEPNKMKEMGKKGIELGEKVKGSALETWERVKTLLE